jgi:prenyltransferase beta subunit
VQLHLPNLASATFLLSLTVLPPSAPLSLGSYQQTSRRLLLFLARRGFPSHLPVIKSRWVELVSRDSHMMSHDLYTQPSAENKELLTECWHFNQEALQEYVLYCCQHPEGGLIDKPGK